MRNCLPCHLLLQNPIVSTHGEMLGCKHSTAPEHAQHNRSMQTLKLISFLSARQAFTERAAMKEWKVEGKDVHPPFA